MIRILFEPHAQTTDNEAGVCSGWRDEDLSPRGEAQTRALGERYAEQRIDAIYCSDLQRACRTAQLAFGERGIPIHPDARLRECDYGQLTGHPRAEVFGQKLRRIDAPYPGGESLRQAMQRVGAFLLELDPQHDGHTVLLVGHRATQYGLEHWLNHRPLEEIVATPYRWLPGVEYRLDKEYLCIVFCQ